MRALKIGNRTFDLENRTYIMGILNVTPDSFSDGGKFHRMDAALFHTEKMIAQGADLVDVGGESTRPGHTVISEEEEITRVAPVIARIKAEFDIPVSIDTYKSRVAQAALDAGADLVNDIWGLKADQNMAALIAEWGVPCCLMHNRDDRTYGDFIPDVLEDLRQSIALADTAGIPREHLILDPGVGFGKDREQNLEIINKLEMLHTLDCPILLGTSRKSVIGLTLDLPVEERLEGTLATTVIGVLKGCAFVRVHDIEANKRAIQMTEAILGKESRKATRER